MNSLGAAYDMALLPGQFGDASLPSSSAALDLVQGKPGAVISVVGSTALRAGLIATGAALAGLRGKPLLRASVGGALAIEAFVLAWIWWRNRSEA